MPRAADPTEPPRPDWDAGDAHVQAQLARFQEMGFPVDLASEIVTSAARVLAEPLRAARTEADAIGVIRGAAHVVSRAVHGARAEHAAKRLPILDADCRRGCAHCCKLHVSISAPEALVLAAFLRDTLDPRALAALRAKVEQVAAAVRALDQAARVRATIDCPLLRDGACSVYPVRPLVCAGATSIRASACEAAVGDPEAAIPIEPIVHGVARAVQLGLATAIGARGLDAGRYELAGALATALSTPDAAARWLAGDRLFERAAGDLSAEVIERTAMAFVARDPRLRG